MFLSLFFVSDNERSPELREPSGDQHKDKDKLKRSDRHSSRHSYSRTHPEPAPSPIPRNPASTSELRDQCSFQVQCSSHLSQKPKVHRRTRAGISFCFARRSQLKLDSCASVFNDGPDDQFNDQGLRRQPQKVSLHGILSQGLPVLPTSTQEDHNLFLDQPKTDQEDSSLEVFEVKRCIAQSQRHDCLKLHGPDLGRKISCQEKTDQETGLFGTHEDSVVDLTDKCLSETETDCRYQNPLYLNVVGKDGRKLKWPCELVKYTCDQPCVSYSCNPFCIGFKCAENQEDTQGCQKTDDGSSKPEEILQDISKAEIETVTPKRHKRKVRKRIRKRKLNVEREQWIGYGPETFSQIPNGGQSYGEIISTEDDQSRIEQKCKKKRHKFRKKRRSLRKKAANQTRRLSLKSIIVNNFSSQTSQIRKSTVHLSKQRAFLHTSIQSPQDIEDDYHWYDESKQAGNRLSPFIDKSGSWEIHSDLSSDDDLSAFKLERDCPSPTSTSSYSWRSGHYQTNSYIRRSSHNSPCYGYRHTPDSSDRERRCRQDYWDYQDSELYRDRNYSGFFQSPCVIKQRCNIRRQKRIHEENKSRQYQNLGTKRICIYRVYGDAEPHETKSDWWCERLSPRHRKQRDRNRDWLSSDVCKERKYYHPSPLSRHSPASSSTTSISDLSVDCSSPIKASSSYGQQPHPSDLKSPAERSTGTKVSHSKEPKPKARSPSSQPRSDHRPESALPNSTVKQKCDSSHQIIPTNTKAADLRVRSLTLPLIGKLPSLKKGTRQVGINTDKLSRCGNQVQTCSKPVNQARFKTLSDPPRIETSNSTLHQSFPPSSNRRPADLQHGSGHGSISGNLKQTSETSDNQTSSCTTPPLTKKPITFTEDEIDKYRLLQLQAQQHMQQQHLQQHHNTPIYSSAMDVPGPNHTPILTPEPSNQILSAPCPPYTIDQPETAVSIYSPPCPSHKSPHSAVHPSLSQSHFASFPFPAVFYPASPAVFLSAHPVHLISAANLHPPGLALQTLTHTSLLSSVLNPTHLAAGVAFQIHPLLPPLFPRQDIQNYSSIAS